MGPGKEKVKSAKKIQKDMEKWAKLLNQKSKMPINQVPYHSLGKDRDPVGYDDF